MRKIIHVVDDDASVRASTSFLLTSHGYSTRIYDGGTEFLGQADLETGCVLLDLHMADLSGLEVLEALHQRGSGAPVIILTGDGDVATAVQALRLGAVDYIQKPYEERDLIAAIELALAGGGADVHRNDAKRAALEQVYRLSGREKQVLRGLLGGMTNKEMARLLDLSPRTIEMHRSTMMMDLGVDAAADAIRIAIAAELTPLDESRTAALAEPPVTPCPRPALVPSCPAPDRAQATGPLSPPVLEALEASTDCAILLDGRFRIVFLNREALALVGTGRDFVGADFWEAFPDARLTDAYGQLNRAAADRIPVRFDFFCPDLGRWLAVKASPVPGGLQVSCRDLTAERTADAAIRQSEEQLRVALEAAGDGAWDWDIENLRFHISSCYVERLIHGHEAMIVGLAEVWRRIHPDDRAAVKARILEHLAGRRETFVCEYRIRSGDGTWRWSVDRGRIVARDPVTGAATRMVGTSTDITTLQSMKRMVAEANARIAMAQECAGAGLWEYDVGCGAIRLCARSREMLGLTGATEPLDIEDWKAVVHPDDLAGTLEAFDRAVVTGEPFSARYRVILPNGQVHWIHGTGRGAGRVDDRIVRMIGLNLDETEQTLAIEKLEILQAGLLEIAHADAVGTMAVALADELNQPLTAISNYVQGLKLALSRRERKAPPELAAVLDETEASARQASRILRRIREKTSLQRLRQRPERLSAVIGDAVRVALAGTAHAGIRLKVSVAPEADPVMVDRIQIQQVIVNLLRNAAEAMEDMHGEQEIAIRAAIGASGKVEVTVTDRGSGVPDEIVGQFFFPFASTRGKGAGIGLTVSRAIIEAHGGRIWAEPAEGGGTSIGFTLEAAREHDSGLHAQAA